MKMKERILRSMEAVDLLEWERRLKLLEVFRDLPASFLIEQDWGLSGYKNKEGKEIQIGTLECFTQEGSDCLNVNGSPTGASLIRLSCSE